MIGFTEARKTITKEFINKINELKNQGILFDIIAGTATAGIPWAAFIAQELNLPMAYIRSEKKAHGAGRQIEGADFEGKSVLVIEDLISTGGSSIKAVEASREAGAKEVQIISIFSYNFKKAFDNFSKENISWYSLSNFEVLLQVAKENHYITEAELNTASTWNKAPETYGI